MLAHKYDPSIDPTGYYASEKFDGARCIYYNGKFLSRTNKPFNAPEWFSQDFPKDVVLDGELFTKRQDFSKIMSIIRKKVPIDSEWKKIKFMVFDIPTVRLSFAERLPILKDIIIKSKSPYATKETHIELVDHILIKNVDHLHKIHEELVKQGAEGTMLNHPNYFYENSRSKGLLKYKDFQDDEAVVEDFEYGEGRNEKVMGNLIVRWLHKKDNNLTFDVGSGFTDEQRLNHKKLFPKGTIIKVKFFELTSRGAPRFPTFIGIVPKKYAH
jgi:DNA ligase-1